MTGAEDVAGCREKAQITSLDQPTDLLSQPKKQATKVMSDLMKIVSGCDGSETGDMMPSKERK